MEKCFDIHNFEELSNLNYGIIKDGYNMMNDIFRYNENSVVFDVGATVSTLSHVLADKQFCGKIYCFEPHPILVEKITEKYPNNINTCIGFSDIVQSSLNFQVPCYSVALGTFLEKEYIKTASCSQEIIKIPIHVSVIDIFCQANGIEMIDFLKINTNGMEFKILKGAEYMLTNNKIKALLVTIYDQDYNREEMIQYMAKHNYKVYNLRGDVLVFISLVNWKLLRK